MNQTANFDNKMAEIRQSFLGANSSMSIQSGIPLPTHEYQNFCHKAFAWYVPWLLDELETHREAPGLTIANGTFKTEWLDFSSTGAKLVEKDLDYWLNRARTK